jgi:hypothetical protein
MTKRTGWTTAACAAAMALAVSAGCDSGASSENVVPPVPDQPAKVSPPTSVPTPLLPAVGPAATQPVATDPLASAPSYLYLKEVPDPRKTQAAAGTGGSADDPNDFGKAVEFPRARLRLTGKGGHNVVALLYSDDPKEALKANWAGDRYYFRMPLQITDRRQIDGSQYRMVAELDGTDETSNGVFLKGDEAHLEPVDLWVIFENQGPRTVASIGGLFKLSDADNPAGEPRWFQVKGIVQAVAE